MHAAVVANLKPMSIKKVLCFKVEGQITRGQPRKPWKNQVEDEIKKIGLKKEDALNRSKWQKGVKMVMSGMG